MNNAHQYRGWMSLRARVVFIPLFLLALVLPTGTPASVPLGGSIAPMLAKVLPGVVNISTRSVQQVRRRNPLLNDPFFRQFFDIPERRSELKESQSLGSGVIIDAERGWIVTSYHVVENADAIRVTLHDKRTFDAKVLGKDPEVDLALLHIEPQHLTAVPLADSDKLQVGDFVVAVGNPFGLGQTVTSGIISALGRTGLGIEGYEDFIQTDASINPGNSGGALVTLEGKLAGINTAIVGPSGGNVGIGFAIPANMVRTTVDLLARYGEVKRGQLGIAIQDITPELKQAFGLAGLEGAVVAQVMEGSPADKAGLRAGDVILAVDGHPVENGSDLRNAIGFVPVGSRVRLDLVRGGKALQIEAVIADLHAQKTSGAVDDERLAGLLLGPITRDHPLSGRVEGIEVLGVERNSLAAKAGLRPGDVITSINRRPVQSLSDVTGALVTSRTALLLHVLRGNSAMFVVIE